MEISTLQIIAIFLFSCIAGMGSVLDEFQTHRPLIACTVIGLILGDLKTGIILGGTLELIALGWMNVGAAQSPDSALASIISAILVIVGQQSIATGIAIALPVAAAGQVLTVFARTITVVFQHAADKAAEEARFRTRYSACLRAWRAGAARCYSGTDCLAVRQRRYGQQYVKRHSRICDPRTANCWRFYRGGRLRHGATYDGREIFDAFLFPRFPRRWLPRSQSAGVRWRRRDHGPALHPAKSTVA